MRWFYNLIGKLLLFFVVVEFNRWFVLGYEKYKEDLCVKEFKEVVIEYNK